MPAATGRLGTSDLAGTIGTTQTVYTCPTGYFAVVNVTICNRNASSVTVRVAVATSASPGAAEWIEYGTTIPANAVLERTGLVLSAGQLLAVSSSTTSVNAVAYGIETSTT
jgi:hypothetical protein